MNLNSINVELLKKAINDCINSINKSSSEKICASIMDSSVWINDCKSELKNGLEKFEDIYKKLLDTLNSYKESATTSIEYIKDKLQKALDYLNEIKDELKSEEEINAYLTSKTASFEEEINKTKDQFFEDFENAHGEDIKKAKEEIEKRKQELINNLKKN